MKFLFVICTFIFSKNLLADSITNCGTYMARGVVRASNHKTLLVVNEKTRSEFRISFSLEEELRLAPYINQSVSAEILLNKQFNGTLGEAQKIIQASSRIPSPLNSEDTGFKLLQKQECLK